MRGLRVGTAIALVFLGVTSGAGNSHSQSETQADWLESSSQSGPVEATVRLRPLAPRIGDILELELEVHAEAEVELLMPEFGEALGRFQIVDFSPISRIEEGGASVAIQHYTLAPTLSGEHRIPALLVEFIDHREGYELAPADEDAYELLTEPISFEVSSVLTDDAPRELRPPLGALAPLRDPRTTAALWGGSVLGVLALAAAGFFVLRTIAARRGNESPYAAARRELGELLERGHPRIDDRDAIDAFFVALSSIVRRYIEQRFALRSPELTTEEFLAELQRSPDLLRSHQALLAELLGVSDLVKFARHTPDRSVVDHSIEIAGRFIEATREAEDAEPGRV